LKGLIVNCVVAIVVIRGQQATRVAEL